MKLKHTFFVIAIATLTLSDSLLCQHLVSAEPIHPKSDGGAQPASIDEVLHTPEEDIDLTTAILLAYKEWKPNLDVGYYRHRLDEISEGLAQRIKTAKALEPSEQIKQIVSYLAEDLELQVQRMSTLDQTQQQHSSIGEVTLLTHLLDKREGQCISFSLLYLALAERLRLPLFLVTVPYHSFVRYDDGRLRFNIETLQDGQILEDTYYKEWKNVSSELVAKGIYLRTLSKKEVLGFVLYDLAHLYAERNDTVGGIRVLTKSLTFWPANFEATQALGGFYLQQFADAAVASDEPPVTPLRQAMEAFQRALDSYPDYVDALINLGTAHMMMGAYDNAAEKFRRVLEIKPDYGPAHQRLATVYAITKRYELAWPYANKAAALGWPIEEKSYEEIKHNLNRPGRLALAASGSGVAIPEALVIHFFGANEQEHGRDMVKGWIESWTSGGDPLIHELRIPSPIKLESSLKVLGRKGNVVEVIVQYPISVQRQQRLGHNPYPGEHPYTPETLELMDKAAGQVTEFLHQFHDLYPEAKIGGFATGLGVEILVRTLKEGHVRFGNLMLYYPPLSIVENSTALIDALKQHGYRQDEVTVIAYVGDPTIPYLEKLKTDNVDLFKFLVIEAAN